MASKTIEFTFQFNGTDRIADRWDAAAPMSFNAAMMTALMWIQGDAVREAPAHQGNLRNSIQIDGGSSFPNAEGRVFSTLAHAPVMELGRRPGARPPPSAALERWGQLVLGESGLGFILARSIGKKGIEGHFFFDKAFHKNTGNIDDLFGETVNQVLRTM